MDMMERGMMTLAGGARLSFVTAGDRDMPPLLLLHGFPSSSRTFRDVIPTLARVAYVIAPDLPGFGASDVLEAPSFRAFGDAISALLEHLSVGPRFIYLHDFGAPVGLEIAMSQPDKVLGLIVQNANAHASGQGPGWESTKAFWSAPSPENEAAATAHLNFEGTRAQYVSGVPQDIAELIPASSWETDWAVMQLPGRMVTHRALIADYGRYTAGFPAISTYLHLRQPPALMIWGRHDAFFDLSETLSWMRTLPRMEAHILDAGHFVLETHAPLAADLMVGFIEKHTRAG